MCVNRRTLLLQRQDHSGEFPLCDVSVFLVSVFIAILTSSRAFQTALRQGVTTRSLSNSIPKMALSQDELKKMVGYKAVDDYVASGMKVGLGTGSTAAYAVERLAKLASGELNIICVPTSERTREQALSLNIPLCTLNEESALDVSIDGADDVDTDLCLVKGGGGALLKRKW